MSNQSKVAVVVWAPYERRAEVFGKELDATVYNIHYLQYKRPLYAPFKYPMQALKTLQILFRNRPKYVYVTNPPVFAAMFTALYCRLAGAQYIMDTHPPALYSKKWSWTLPLQRWMAKGALVNLTDQDRFRKLFESWGTECIVLQAVKGAPDVDRDIVIDPNACEIAVVNTFAVDEPLDIILEAARSLPNVQFSIMGDLKKADKAVVDSAPVNVKFTDYLLGKDYWNCLYRSRAIMVLTTYPHSLLGGANDGVVLGKPLILSRQPVLTETFTLGTIFVENTTEGLIDGVQRFLAQEETLKQEIVQLGVQKVESWNTNLARLKALMP